MVPSSQTQKIAPLKNAFRGKFLIGAILGNASLEGRATLDSRLATTHFNALTPENALKPDAVQPREGEFRFDGGDRMVEICQRHGMTAVGHTLVWHSQTPRWFFTGENGGPLTREVALKRMRAHIGATVGHFRGKIKQWDVVNEAINDGPGILRPSPWLAAIGDDFIAEAFRAAHAADPKALLVYNDYNIELAYKRPKTIQMLKGLIAQKVPIHGVGIQCHWRMDNPDFAEVETALKEYAALGLKIMITELDLGVLPTRYQGADISRVETMTPEQRAVMNPYTGGLPESAALAQAERYRQAFELFFRYRKSIDRVTFWGTHDGSSWLDNFPIRGRTDYPLLFDRAGEPKPAFFAVARQAGAKVTAPTKPAPGQTPAGQTPAGQGQAGGAIASADDKPAFSEPPAGIDAERSDVPHGKLETIEYDSRTVGTRRKLQVYTPPGYSAEKKYPVLYLLHGIGGDETEWQRFASPNLLLDNLIAEKKARPMIVVMPNGRAQKDDRPIGNVYASAPAFATFERDLLDDVIPAIEARYSVRRDRDDRAIAGLSMGGGQALNFGLGHLETFAWVGGFSSAPNTKSPEQLVPDPKAAKSKLKLLFLSCGNKDGLLRISQGAHTYLKTQDVPHIWHVDGQGHDGTHWKNSLYHFLQRVFSGR